MKKYAFVGLSYTFTGPVCQVDSRGTQLELRVEVTHPAQIKAIIVTSMPNEPADIAHIVETYRSHGWTQCVATMGISKHSMYKRLTRYWRDNPEQEELDQCDTSAAAIKTK